MKNLTYLFILLLLSGFIAQTAFSQAMKTNQEINATTVLPFSKEEVQSGTDNAVNNNNSTEKLSPGTNYYNPQAYRGISVGGTYIVGPTGNYASITDALTDMVTNGISDAVYLELQPTYISLVETFPITFGTTLPTTVSNFITIRPQTGATGLSITSASATQTIYMNGGKYINFDGRPGGLGTTSQLTIENTALTGTAFTFINDAQFNSIKYCTVKGVYNSTVSGVILFSTAASTGNSNNTIDNCTIQDGVTTPSNLIYSLGTAGFPNVNNTVSNSNLLNWFSGSTVATAAILLSTGNSAWTITGNSFYQTASRNFDAVTVATTKAFIFVSNTTGFNYTITNNYIGGTAPNCGGSQTILTATTGIPTFRGIFFATGTGTASTISGNTIANISMTCASVSTPAFIVHGGGSANITGNTFGSQSAAGNVAYTNSGTSAATTLFVLFGAGSSCTFTGNNIGGITLSTSSTGAVIFRMVYTQAVTPAAINYSNNLIGGTVANSILQNTAANVYGIMSLSTSLNQQINNNTIRNISVNNVSAVPTLNGMYLQGLTGGSMTATGNIIHTLSSNSPNLNINNVASVVGLILTASTNAGSVISGNTIYNLINTNASAAICVTGMYYGTPAAVTGQTVISRNFIHSFSTVSNTGYQIGIFFPNTGVGMIFNNMIRLGIDATGASITTSPFILGIWKASSADAGVYFNSIYVGGSGVTNNVDTYGYYRSTASTADTVMNNILYNARSNASGLGINYAIVLDAITGISCNYNDIIADGTGGMFGNAVTIDYANLGAWQGGTALDINSVGGNPNFVNSTGNSSAVNLHVAYPTPIESAGFNITYITDDFDGQTRASLTPTDIGADAGNFSSALSLTLTAMLSGYCNGTTMNYTKSVTVELHNSSTPYALVESQVVTLSTSGTANPIFSLAANGTPYYIVIRTDNGLETWSATPQTFTGSTLTYDFTDLATKAFGSNMLQVGTKWCIISGDVDQDGSVGALDRSACWNDRNLVGVYATDLDGDGSVGALDRSICWNNRNSAVAKPTLALSPIKGVKQDNNGNTKAKSFDLRLDGSNAKKVTK